MFERLFNHSQEVWRDGQLVFASSWPQAVLWLVLAGATVAIVLTLAFNTGRMSLLRRCTIGVLQWVAVAVALLMLWQPVLEVEQTRRGENTVAMLLDTSRSMDIQDVDGNSRSAVAREIVMREGLVDEGLFDVERYTLAPTARPMDAADRPSAERSPIAESVTSLIESVDDRSLAAVVLVSDGAENQSRLSAAWWQSVAAAGVPIHVIGLGSTEHGNDVELADVQLPVQAAKDATVAATVRLRHAAGASPVRLTVSSANELLLAEDVALDTNSDETLHLARFTVPSTGIRELDFRISANQDDPNPVNDTQTRIIQIADQKRRVLYVEGEPRWEYKFIRRALDGHAGVEIVSLLRTSPNKFYRQGVRDSSELQDGFPRTREALFHYDAIIIGSFEAAQLDPNQQAALRDFVNTRGGSLLMLGGREGLADGGWARSALAAALPVTLDARLDAQTYVRDRLNVTPTRQGLRSGWLNLGEPGQVQASLVGPADPTVNATPGTQAGQAAQAAQAPPVESDPLDLWLGLPALADHQDIGTVKPGALVLLESLDGQPVYVTQRYGLGASQVLGTGGTWRWQMGLPSEDQRHEQFWQTVVARLAESGLPRIDITPESTVIRDKDTTVVHVVARDGRFDPLSAESLNVQVTAPDGAISDAVLVADQDQPGRYSLGLPTQPAGVWSVQIEAVAGGESPVGEPVSAEAFWLTESEVAEDFNTRQQQDFLQRVAAVSGGTYLTAETAGELPDALQSNNAALTRLERLPLWNMPALFLLLLAAKLIEWALRLRWKRL
jgi:hypothetical protein